MTIIEEMARAASEAHADYMRKRWGVEVSFDAKAHPREIIAALNVLRRRGYLNELGIAAAKQAEGEGEPK